MKPNQFTFVKLLVIAFFVIVSFVSNISAQESIALKLKNEDDSPKGILDGHTFMTNPLVKSPFIKSYLSNILGIGNTIDFSIPAIEVNGEEVLALKGDLIFATLGFTYQQAIRDWLAFFGKFQLVTRIGNQPQALIAQGINLSTSFEFGWLAKLFNNKKMQLSTFLYLNNVSATTIDLLGFVNGVLDSGSVTPSNKLIKSTPVTKLNTGLLYAYAFNRTFGMQAQFEAGYGSSLDVTKDNEWITSWGLAFDCDLKPNHSVPIGFLFAYYNRNYDDTQVISGLPLQFLFQISYTGREDFEFGVAVNYQTFRESTYESKLQFVNLTSTFKYYF